ncbi:CheR family methyltransferase [Phenylobacterium sp.]|uniref:CheR family methyltransferase n=1 Tax=Phenylobacterium sp. TaxID=1871053 RepID=UPI0027352D75|nr:CheR family methyltransferase [Phenylobacterium sp.]MDP3852761.1 CheR family methyltransferase [Phenylobacterium sp.]
MNATFSDRDVERFRGLVVRRLGIAFDDTRLSMLADVMRRRVKASGGGAEAYLMRLGSDPAKKEVAALARELTVPETYFFRNMDQFHALRDAIMPERLAARSSRGPLRILSAGCASGEEAYSIAILAHEVAADVRACVSIRAIDVNPEMLEKADRARFSDWAFRETSPDVRQRWFRQEGQEFVLDDRARRAVEFAERNLIDDDPEFWRPQSYDVVFCRNVIMYFSMETARAVVSRLAEALVPGGYLFLGHAETLRGLSQDFHLRHTHGTFYYQRRDAGVQSWERSAPTAVRRAVPLAAAANDSADSEAWIAAIGGSTQRIELLARTMPPPRLNRMARPSRDFGPTLDLMSRERFAEAIGLLEALPPEAMDDPDAILLRAALLVHSGQLDSAETTSRRLLAIDEMSAGAHYVLALCREGAGDVSAAAEQDRMAIHLDPSFAMPHLHLGLLGRRAGDVEVARAALDKAFVLLRGEEPARLLLFGGGFTREALLALCRAEQLACGRKP